MHMQSRSVSVDLDLPAGRCPGTRGSAVAAAWLRKCIFSLRSGAGPAASVHAPSASERLWLGFGLGLEGCG